MMFVRRHIKSAPQLIGTMIPRTAQIHRNLHQVNQASARVRISHE
jgi:hypothetical protein